MRLYHATHRRNVVGILRAGLLAHLASGKRPAVWACTRGNIRGAIRHAIIHRDVDPQDVVVIEMTVPKSWVRGFAVAGMVYINRDVPPSRLRVHCSLAIVKA